MKLLSDIWEVTYVGNGNFPKTEYLAKLKNGDGKVQFGFMNPTKDNKYTQTIMGEWVKDNYKISDKPVNKSIRLRWIKACQKFNGENFKK